MKGGSDTWVDSDQPRIVRVSKTQNGYITESILKVRRTLMKMSRTVSWIYLCQKMIGIIQIYMKHKIQFIRHRKRIKTDQMLGIFVSFLCSQKLLMYCSPLTPPKPLSFSFFCMNQTATAS